MASTFAQYTNNLPKNIGGAVATSILGGYFSAYLCRGLLHTTSLRQGMLSGATALVDAAITPLIHSDTHSKTTLILRKALIISALYAYGTPILLINTIVANILPAFETSNPTINHFLFLVKGSFGWTSSLEGALVSITTVAVALVASRILQYVSEKILNESNDGAHALLTSACYFATAFFIKDPKIGGLSMTEDQLWIIKATLYVITLTSAYIPTSAYAAPPIKQGDSDSMAAPWGISYQA